MLRPNFEDPLDSARQLVQKNITLIFNPNSQIWRQFLLESSIPEYKILGENVIFANNSKHYINMSRYDVLREGTHARMTSSISPAYMKMGKRYNSGRGWYRSQERVSGKYPYSGFLTNKRWHLNKVRDCAYILIAF